MFDDQFGVHRVVAVWVFGWRHLRFLHVVIWKELDDLFFRFFLLLDFIIFLLLLGCRCIFDVFSAIFAAGRIFLSTESATFFVFLSWGGGLSSRSFGGFLFSGLFWLDLFLLFLRHEEFVNDLGEGSLSDVFVTHL